MGMGQGVRTGLGHGASPVFYRHNFLVFFCFFFLWGGGGGGGAGETLENNSLFLGNKTNIRECLTIILKNKADHKKSLLLYPFLPTYISPYTTHFMALLGNNYSFLVLLL